ncbi:MAG: class II aldolase/adducin family protein [Chloroflexi bacterium]|nr:class II aldolase/adducin family protein [Chloroflexota bacterium]
MAQTRAVRTIATTERMQELRGRVALANRVMHHYGLTTYLGHVSARIPGTDRIVIKARPHVSMDRVRPENLMVIDLGGNILEASKEYPTIVAEWPLHTELYKARPDVNCVVHTHQKWCTIFGIAGRAVLPVHHPGMASVAAEPWPIYEESYEIVVTVQQARVVAQILGRHGAIHLRTHGMAFVGTDIERAVNDAINGEHEAEMTWHALLAGTPETISMIYMRPYVDARFAPQDPGARREGVERGTWENFVWLDQNVEASRYRAVQL